MNHKQQIKNAVDKFCAGFASVRALTPDQEGVTSFGLDSGEPDVATEPLECSSHIFSSGNHPTIEEAVQAFADALRFPYPSIQHLFDLYWRRLPQLMSDRDFESGEMCYRISARCVFAVNKTALKKAEGK